MPAAVIPRDGGGTHACADNSRHQPAKRERVVFARPASLPRSGGSPTVCRQYLLQRAGAGNNEQDHSNVFHTLRRKYASPASDASPARAQAYSRHQHAETASQQALHPQTATRALPGVTSCNKVVTISNSTGSKAVGKLTRFARTGCFGLLLFPCPA